MPQRTKPRLPSPNPGLAVMNKKFVILAASRRCYSVTLHYSHVYKFMLNLHVPGAPRGVGITAWSPRRGAAGSNECLVILETIESALARAAPTRLVILETIESALARAAPTRPGA
jgi:hypothetical protein